MFILQIPISTPKPTSNLAWSRVLNPERPSFPANFSISIFTVTKKSFAPLTIRNGGGPRTYPGGVSKWQWKRMQANKAKQLLKARLCRERQLYEMRKRAELKAAVSELEKPWETVQRAPVLFSVKPDEQLKALADRFQKPGGFDFWSEKDGPELFKTHDGFPSARFFPKGVVHSIQPYRRVSEAASSGTGSNVSFDNSKRITDSSAYDSTISVKRNNFLHNSDENGSYEYGEEDAFDGEFGEEISSEGGSQSKGPRFSRHRGKNNRERNGGLESGSGKRNSRVGGYSLAKRLQLSSYGGKEEMNYGRSGNLLKTESNGTIGKYGSAKWIDEGMDRRMGRSVMKQGSRTKDGVNFGEFGQSKNRMGRTNNAERRSYVKGHETGGPSAGRRDQPSSRASGSEQRQFDEMNSFDPHTRRKNFVRQSDWRKSSNSSDVYDNGYGRWLQFGLIVGE
ncbi:probable DEAD-box ATP-dependent RNA helicase 48 [Amborella trichopoda]|uniref:DEAD-box ATP-dependent RNA helicase 33 n=1 Tax=Amborella trichopoda TaxID=13333 RepID=W1NVZ9_AMBTC|nr:probable DEAD-box ATP-dependent RNA helicase 48 [Amborella trichopoda]ERM99782.1 hypothetical protein AMTR_s00099p00150290 [Amborella trichopoda]|eukprot:XP_006836929.1 probable DEAD-box ATP-dependent RNA helicase 48 [Amborella trichopoda]